MSTPNRERPPTSLLAGWGQPPQRVEPLPGQAGLFDYRPHVDAEGQGELFDTGRDLPGVDESDQQLFWDVAE